MPTTMIDIADTAVKIGLGALITGGFTYLGLKLGKKSEKSMFMLEHKIKLVDQLSSDVEDYFTAWSQFSSPLRAAVTKTDKGVSLKTIPEKGRKALAEKDDALRITWAKKNAVISKLRLLKAGKAASRFSDCVKLEVEIRSAVYFEDVCIDDSYLNEYGKKSKRARILFSEELANFYERLVTD